MRTGLSSPNPVDPVVLRRVLVDAKAFGPFVEVSISHIYVNRGETSVDATYKLPLVEEEIGTLSGFYVEIGGKKLNSEVIRQEEALDQFFGSDNTNKIVAEKKDRPVLLICTVDKIEPDQEANITLNFLTELKLIGTNFLFLLSNSVLGRSVKGENSVPFSFLAHLELQIPDLETVHSPFNKLSVTQEDSKTIIDFSEKEVRIQDDFVVFIKLKEIPTTLTYVEASPNTDTVAAKISMISKLEVNTKPSEYIFLLESSAYTDIQLVKQTLEVSLENLSSPVGSLFNIFLFGGTLNRLFPNSSELDEENIQKALNFLSEVELSSTKEPQLFDLLKEILSTRQTAQIILFTSGFFSNLPSVISLMKDLTSNSRVFAFGLGKSIYHYAVLAISQAGRGTAEFIYNKGNVEEKVLNQMNKAKRFPITNVKANPKFDCTVFLQQNNLFIGEPFSIYLLGNSQMNGSLTLEATCNNELIEYCSVEFHPETATVVSDGVLLRLVMKHKIVKLEKHNDFQIISEVFNISKEHRLLSSHTAFVVPKQSQNVALLCTSTTALLPKTLMESGGLTESAGDTHSDNESGSDEDDQNEESEEDDDDEPKRDSRRVYNHEFLMKFQAYCTEKPEGLNPMLEIILGNTLKTKGGGGGGGGGNREGRNAGNAGGQFVKGHRKGKSGGGQKQKAQNNNPPQPPVPPLQKSEHRWVRPSATESDQQEQIIRKVKGLLNKLTLEKFDSLSDQIINVGITNVQLLNVVIMLIFDKALSEPNFSKMYADLCVKLARNLPNLTQDGQTSNFRRLLLNRCQQEFEGTKGKQESLEGLTELEKEEREEKLKRRALGNIKFIGELYKLKMLNEKIMHTCIQKLLYTKQMPEEDDIETLCKLLTTIGQQLEHGNALDEYFRRLENLSQHPDLAARFRFMIMNLIDLRTDRWVPRRKQEDPKLIKEIHNDAKREEMKKEMQSRAPPLRRSVDSSPRKPENPVPRGPVRPTITHQERLPPALAAPASASGDTWETVGRGRNKGPRGGANEWDHAGGRGKRDKSGGRGEQPKAAPGFQKNWKSSSEGAQAHRGGGRAAPEPHRPNAFSSLANDGRGPKGKTPVPTNIAVNKRPNVEQTEEVRAPVSPSKSTQLSNSGGSRTLSEDDQISEIETAFNEYLSSLEMQDAAQSLRETIPVENHYLIIKHGIALVLDRKEIERENTMKLLTFFFTEGVINEEHFRKGFESVIEMIEDIAVDVPFAPKHLGKFLGKAVLDKYLPLSFLKTALEPLLPSGKALKVLIEVLAQIREQTDIKTVQQLSQEAQLDLTKFLSKQQTTQDIEKCIEDRDKSLSILQS